MVSDGFIPDIHTDVGNFSVRILNPDGSDPVVIFPLDYFVMVPLICDS